MKKILVILGHPARKSLNKSLAEAYIEEAKKKTKVKKLFLNEKLQTKKAQELIKWADHLTIFYPIWWYAPPALLKSFFEKTLTPGFAFKYNKGPLQKKLLKGKTAHLVITSGGPRYYYFIVGNQAKTIVKKSLKFVGIKTTETTHFHNIRKKLPKQKAKKHLSYIKQKGAKLL